jgi:hypothetical protein
MTEIDLQCKVPILQRFSVIDDNVPSRFRLAVFALNVAGFGLAGSPQRIPFRLSGSGGFN